VRSVRSPLDPERPNELGARARPGPASSCSGRTTCPAASTSTSAAIDGDQPNGRPRVSPHATGSSQPPDEKDGLSCRPPTIAARPLELDAPDKAIFASVVVERKPDANVAPGELAGWLILQEQAETRAALAERGLP
jgi:hypothetical protein